ncbi:MAG TPA: hypothetical protein PLG20_09175, partial [Candidatus Syntrophosphaera sp.]|nr:hypothetical protein [Candidatus Syntrophosphaera sp.]
MFPFVDLCLRIHGYNHVDQVNHVISVLSTKSSFSLFISVLFFCAKQRFSSPHEIQAGSEAGVDITAQGGIGGEFIQEALDGLA